MSIHFPNFLNCIVTFIKLYIFAKKSLKRYKYVEIIVCLW